MTNWFQRTIAVVVVVLASGCHTTDALRDYPGVSADQLWRAALAAANDPMAKDWHLIENGVWYDEPNHRIELFRVLKRDVLEVGASHPRREERRWSVSICVLDPDRGERRFAPAIRIEDRTLAQPRKFHSLTDSYFDDVEQRLLHTPVRAIDPPSPNALLSPDVTLPPVIPQPVRMPTTPQPLVAPKSEPIPEPAPATEPIPEPAPAAEPTPEPIPEPAPAAEPTPEPIPEPAPAA
ncbi:MAG: hypothetical protein O2800_07680, partial [Planctomycetota bacterium]|nr:hypothetical protein [Planctomycetota bacterium]